MHRIYRLWCVLSCSVEQYSYRFVDDPELHYIEVLDSGRANIGRKYKGMECDVFVLKKLHEK